MAIAEDTHAEMIGELGSLEVGEGSVLTAEVEGPEPAKELLAEGESEKEQETHFSVNAVYF